MERLRDYEVIFSGLKNGKHDFSFEVKASFFELFSTEQDFRNAQGTAKVLLDKHSTFLKFSVNVAVKVELDCDLSNESFDYFVENDINFLVNFAQEFDDSNEDVISIPFGDHAYNVAQNIYEAIVLAIPMKKISPESKKNMDYYNSILEQFSPEKDEEIEETKQEIDPRWAALNDLKKK